MNDVSYELANSMLRIKIYMIGDKENINNNDNKFQEFYKVEEGRMQVIIFVILCKIKRLFAGDFWGSDREKQFETVYLKIVYINDYLILNQW